MIASRSITEFLVIHCVSWLQPTQNSCQLKSGVFFPWRGDELSVEVRLNQSFTSGRIVPRRINRSIYLACSLSTCFLVWDDPMESPIEWINEKGGVFPSLFLSPFFSVTMMLQVPWGSQGPTGGSKGTVNKDHFSCTPVVPSDSLGAKQRPT